MNLIPFGEVLRDRVEISKRYKLIEIVNGIWRLTKKCRDNYDPESYVHYLKGDVEKPRRISEVKPKPVVKPAKKMTIQEELKSPEYQKLLDEIFNL
jgi:hypothetical protein